MNNQQQIFFIGAILEAAHNRIFLRIVRRQLRDNVNPFEVPENQFRQMYRLDKQSVFNLIHDLEPYPDIHTSVPFHLKVLATLNFTATGSFQNPVGCNSWISLSQSSVSRAINEISSLAYEHLLQDWIKFPINKEDINSVKQGFYEKWGVRRVIGVIDGTHVDIIAPPITDIEHPAFIYINRKGKLSINVMLISDFDKIIRCNARYPGSVHDSAIWQMSNIRNHLSEQYENGDKHSHLLGDSGYPLEPWLFTPFAAVQDGSPEARYNRQFNSVRNIIERTNGILKGRFRCCSKHRVLLYHPVKAGKLIYLCCILHNIALKARLPIQEDDIEYRDDDDNEIQNNIDPNNGYNILQLGRAARDEYVRQNII